MNWDLRFRSPAGRGAAAGGGGGGEEGGGGGGRAGGGVALPIPPHDIGPRSAHVAPGTFKVTLEVDGAATESKTFEVRADPQSAVTLAQHKAREAFVIEVADLVKKIDDMAATLRTRRAAATGDEAPGCRPSNSVSSVARRGWRGGARVAAVDAAAARLSPFARDWRRCRARGPDRAPRRDRSPVPTVTMIEHAERGQGRTGGDRERDQVGAATSGRRYGRIVTFLMTGGVTGRVARRLVGTAASASTTSMPLVT